ncbi:MAG TPA: hypothetical protein VLN08_13650 [Vicinamibacterales bacterium]|nr:hypothetical protein [Vicinamibacterales bacterium]
MASEPDPSLRRVQRDSAIIAIAAVVLALALQEGRPDGALGVLAGAGLMGVSYAAIKGGVTALVQGTLEADRGAPGGRVSSGRVAWILLKFIGRYLVIGLAAWVVLVPFRAHPLGLFAGVTVPVLAIGIEAVRLARAPAGRSS